MESEMILTLPIRFGFAILYSELIIFRLQTLDNDFTGLVKGESEWPPSELPDAKAIYADFYEEIHRQARNIVCGSGGSIGHDEKEYHMVSRMRRHTRWLDSKYLSSLISSCPSNTSRDLFGRSENA